VAFAPGDPALAAAATDSGVYVSQDGGQTWTASELHGGAWSVAFDASTTPATIYAGLQETGAGSGGIRASTDAGVTWSDASAGLRNRDVRCIVVSPGGFAAGTDDGVAFSTNGKTWYDGGLDGDGISALGAIATPPTTVFYAGIDYPATSSGYVFQADPSQSQGWTAITSGLPHGAVVNSISVGPAPQAGAPGPILLTTSKGAFRSSNGGKAWTGSLGIGSSYTVTDAAFSPLDPNLVYAGADAGGSSGGGLWRSTDGGQTFTSFSQGLPTAHPSGQSAPQEVESLAVADGRPYPTVLAALDPYQADAAIYRQVDPTAPSPSALPSATGPVATLPGSSANATVPTAAGAPSPHSTPTAKPASPLAAQVLGTLFHFPAPLLFEVLFVLLLVFLWIRWRRHYYVEGPP